jgi:hypothetical protein
VVPLDGPERCCFVINRISQCGIRFSIGKTARGEGEMGSILAQTGCDCKFDIQAQTCFRRFLPAAGAAGKNVQATRFAGVVDYSGRPS